MSGATSSPHVLWPLVVYIAAVIFMVAFMLIFSALLGERHKKTRASEEPYEAGLVSTGSARLRFHAGFYLMAMFFVIFDLEAAYIYAYAVAFRKLGWAAYGEIAVFIAVLAAALFYLWRLGALDWKTPGQKASQISLYDRKS
ncbi:MAG: NADH-quinone oxidoreductase subunit A [Syntrophobacteraceae bacterium]|nr:NADH-quinone oxidoreductase subunit A [Syntrophobacteraceae bacterium]